MRKYTGYKSNLFRVLTVIVMLTVLTFQAAAVEEPREVTKKGAELVNMPLNTVISNADPVFTSGGWSGQTAIGVKNIILFEIDFSNDANKYFQDLTFTATCRVDILCYGNPSSPGAITQSFPNIDLQVNFNTTVGSTYKAIAEYKFNGAYRVDIVFKGITAPALSPLTSFPVFSLTNKLIVERQYNFNETSTDELKYTTDGQKLTVNWTPTTYPGAESMDLEWTYVDKTSAAGIAIIAARTAGQQTLPVTTLGTYFRNNSSRVNLPPNPASFIFNLNYNDGFILFRMRGVQYRNSDGLRLEGNWNYTAKALIGSIYTHFNQGIVDVDWHEKDLNWQYNAVYAEDGKKKEVISYFDGALRSRQTVNLNNFDNVSVVTEPVYDALGRPSMNIFPAPISDNILKYYKAFNVNNSLKPISYKDIPTANCGIISSALNSSSGVEKYYSANNPFMNDPAKPWNKSIPKSEGFPYTVTQYTPDNTGRIRAQSGVGAAFQLGTGRETKFYYGKPSQYELDRLFGAEAGDHTHYLKNMVVDANKQVNVTYQNSEGKTVATALAGPRTGNLEALPSAGAPTTVIKDIMITPSSFQVNVARSSLEATNTFLVPSAGIYKFTYRFTPEKYTENYSGGTLCYTCSYDLLITLRDECGLELNKTEVKNITPFNTSCANPSELSNFFNVSLQNVGEYTAYFELKVNKETLDAYTEHYLVNNTDIKKLNYFLLEQLVEENMAECYSDCDACKTLPATAAEFITKVQAYYIKEGIPFGTAENSFATSLYNTIKQNCTNISTQCVVSPCAEILEVIKSDVTPGGQYAEYDGSYNLVDPAINVLSYYNQVNYYDENGQPAMVENESGNMVPPSQLTLKEFILKFEDSWATSLAPYHPEYCYYTWCTMNPASQQFNSQLETMNNPEDAVTAGYFDRTNPLKLVQADPFFQFGGYGYTYGYTSQIQADLNAYSVNVMNLSTQTTKNIFQTIDFLLYCGNQTPAISWDACTKSVTDPCRSDYKEWLLYKEWYLELKHKYYTLAMKQVLPQCKNCFIPTSGNTDPGGWTTCTAPPVSDFSVADVPNSSAGDGTKRIVIKYKNGNETLSWPVLVTVVMTVNSTGLSISQDIVFTPGFGSQELIVQDMFNNFNVTQSVCTQLTGKNAGQSGLKTAEGSPATGNFLFCPSQTDFIWSYIPGNQGSQIEVCYTGPTLQPGQVVTLPGKIMFNWSQFFEFSLEFCAGQSSCKIVAPYVDSYWEPTGYIDVEFYPVSCKVGNCTESCFNEGMDYTINYLTGEVCSLSNEWTGLSIQMITDYGTMYYAIGNPGQGNCAVFPDWVYYYTPIVASAVTVTGNCPTGGWTCPVTDNNYSSTQQFNPATNTWDITLCYTGPAIPAGKKVRVFVTATNAQCFPNNPTVNFEAQFCASTNCFTYKIPFSSAICDAYWGLNFNVTCTDDSCGTACPSGDCCTDPRYNQYKGKVRRFQDYLTPDFNAIQGSILANPSNGTAYPLASCKNECEAMADAWMAQLKNCTTDLQKLERVRRQLINICKNSCTAQQGNTSIHPFADQNPSPSFESVINAEFGSQTPNCAYDLISDPYPWGKVPAIEKTFATEASTAVCTRLQQLRTEAQTKGYANTVAGVHQYLKDYYAPYYNLEDDELQQLFDACNGCNGIMKLPVELPLFMNGDAKVCLPCTVYEQMKTDFAAKYPGLAVTHDNYETLFRNYMNHRTGFSHAYASYYDFGLKCTANLNNFRLFGKICETPLSLEADVNTLNQCMDEKFYNALSNATVIYTRYIEEIKRIYRNNYTAKCLSVKPRLEAEDTLYEYHYTLYYYDQSDNLVKTIPPQGVAYLTETEINTLWADRNQFIVPPHTLATTYQYNSFNQVVKQYSPDGGTSEFWYDRLGRLAISQSEEQKTPANGGVANRYSYTKYEPVLGRITEVGEKSGALPIPDTKNNTLLQNWLASGTDIQITSTIYDKADLTQVTNTAITNEQQFYTSRKRLVATIFRKTRYASASQYDAATHYSYDILGNAKTVWQENTRLKEADPATLGLKRMDYEFDLVAGKVNRVWYQKNKGDQFIYEYKYDAENRLISAQTSRDGLVWQEDATYKYYLHGPLARTELGRLKVQGTDYAYTLQGWLKYINAPVINETVDISRDGDPTLAGNTYKSVARDAMGYGISYFNGEYKPIYSASPLPWNEVIPAGAGTGKNLFNGNIRATTAQIAQLGGAKTYSYSYDQLNRIVKMRKHETSYVPGGSVDPYLNILAATDEYKEDITYDANGNILSYLRNGTASQVSMDDLTYQYPKDAGGKILNNRLRYVQDPVPDNYYAEDINSQTSLNRTQVLAERLPEQATDNYIYDKIGNLVKDKKEDITKIEWTVYGKISKITKNDAASTTIEYEYDASGNRIYKKVSTGGSTGTIKHTFYVRDASGNTMAIYTRTDLAAVLWSEQHLYGSSRVGMYLPNMAVPASAPLPPAGSSLADGVDMGKVSYELSNHLGNVLVTVSDKKIQTQNGNTGTVLYYSADVQTAMDYYPFGMTMPGRKYEPQNGYRYGFNGKEKDKDMNSLTAYDYGFRIYNPGIGKFLSVDPLSKDYPWSSTYAFTENNPLENIDLDGTEKLDFRFNAGVSFSIASSGKPSFSVTGAAGVGYTLGPVQSSAFANINVYNGGLGTPGKSSAAQFDVSASTLLTVGIGNGSASNPKSINYRTSSPIDDVFGGSLSYGISWSYSSGANTFNRQAIINIKGGPASLHYHNDADSPPGGSGRDTDWSGGLGLYLNTDALGAGKLVGTIGTGFEVYTGVGFFNNREAPYDLTSSPPPLNSNSNGNIYYDQTVYQRSLNKNSSFIQFGNSIFHRDTGDKNKQADIHTGKGFIRIGKLKLATSNNPIFHFDNKGDTSLEVKQISVSGGSN
jgi:RHS repeat-associated protein